MLRCVALLRTDVSKLIIASIIRVRRIGELGTLAISSNGGTVQSFTSGRFVVLISWENVKPYWLYNYELTARSIILPKMQEVS
jgi:hypothetical protein